MGQHKHNPTAIAAAKGELPREKNFCPSCGAKMDGGFDDATS